MGNGIEAGEKRIILEKNLNDWEKSRKDHIGRKGKEWIEAEIFYSWRQYNRST